MVNFAVYHAVIRACVNWITKTSWCNVHAKPVHLKSASIDIYVSVTKLDLVRNGINHILDSAPTRRTTCWRLGTQKLNHQNSLYWTREWRQIWWNEHSRNFPSRIVGSWRRLDTISPDITWVRLTRHGYVQQKFLGVRFFWLSRFSSLLNLTKKVR